MDGTLSEKAFSVSASWIWNSL